MPSQDITVYRGDSLFLKTSIVVGGIAQNITGWQFFFTIKKNYTDADSLAIIKDLGDWQPTAPLTGKTEYEILATATKNLELGNFVYDLKAKNPTNSVFTIARGRCIIQESVTIRT